MTGFKVSPFKTVRQNCVAKIDFSSVFKMIKKQILCAINLNVQHVFRMDIYTLSFRSSIIIFVSFEVFNSLVRIFGRNSIRIELHSRY